MGFSGILLIMAIALILFGPKDLPNIARTIGKIFFEIRKVTNDLTKEFQSPMGSPGDILNKTFEQRTSPRVAEQVTQGAQENSITSEKLLTYEDEIPPPQESSKAKVEGDPLAELPLDMVSYAEKRGSR